MSGAFRYKPKFVDIRVRPPEPEAKPDAPAPEPKPGERACDHAGCRQPAVARAPKSREHMDEFYWFCAPHAAEYNKGWNYFEGMSEDEQERFRADAHVGHRPTWQFKASRMSREAAAFAAKFGSGAAGKGAGAYADAFGMFGAGASGQSQRRAGAEGRTVGRLESRALTELDLEAGADGATIRARYTDLVKRFHPDSNGGDRAMEDKLQRVIRAYKTLRAAKLA
ncbi:MAG: J domain-containing protein [Caulobacteraceae bacterium]|nr:J domain-containing protein [Caulobacter sp.]